MNRCDKFKWSEHITEENWQPGAAMNCSVCQHLGEEECPVKSCAKCVYGLTCSRPTRDRDGCLDEDFKYFEYGDPRLRLLKLQRSGEINIVIGGEGEHEVNANWTMDEAHKHLADTCEACGGLVVRDGLTQLLLMKAYGPSFVLQWMHGCLYNISIRQHTTWWEAK